MAIVDCPHCGGKISGARPVCPHCKQSTQQAGAQDAAPGRSGKRGGQPKKPGILGVTGGIIALLFVGASLFPGGDDSMRHATESRAVAACESRVSQRLVSPGTASFSPWDNRVQDRGDHRWVITGHVDAENMMGGTLRANWHCDITATEGGGWETTKIEVWE